MILLLSGEGATDFGGFRYLEGDEVEKRYHPGPMAHLLDVLALNIVGYSFIDLGLVEFIGETKLKERGKQAGSRRAPRLRGLKTAQETAYFERNAQALALFAKELGEERKDDVIAVLFRDCDGTNSDSISLWRDKVTSIERGFRLTDFELGVPMVPRPKSEAWLICALNGYQHCDALEEASGNDNSPNSLKKQLAALTGEIGPDDLVVMIEDGKIDPYQIEMPSFREFRRRLEDVLRAILTPARPQEVAL